MKTSAMVSFLLLVPAALPAQAADSWYASQPLPLHEATPAQVDGQDASGVGPVVLGAVIGGLVPTVAYAATQFGSDQSSSGGTLPVVWASGAALGAMLGAAMGRRRVAPRWTLLGAAVAAVPFIVFAPESDDWGGAIVVVLSVPVAGAVIGNELGQSR